MSGIINSVNTNTGAMIALDSLDETNQALAVTQKQVSTGFRVADASDDGAAFAIATTVRSTVGALNSANQQLGASQGLLSTTNSALTNIATTMGSMRDTLVKLADSSLSVSERTQDQAQYHVPCEPSPVVYPGCRIQWPDPDRQHHGQHG